MGILKAEIIGTDLFKRECLNYMRQSQQTEEDREANGGAIVRVEAIV